MHKKECLIYYILAKVNMNTNIYIDNMKRLGYYKEKINACLQGKNMNSEEIAKLANVSRSTVSRVVNNYKNVPETTRKKVQDVIDKYGYTPSSSARTLAGKSNDIIGLFIADIDHTNNNMKWVGINSPYNSELLSKVIQSCKKRGYMVLVNTITKEEECRQLEQHFKNRMLFGGIFVGFPYHMKALEEISEKKYNMVFIDQWQKNDSIAKNVNNVNCDNVKGAKLVVEYLIEQGHRDIAFVKGDYRLSSFERLQGYKEALTKNGIPINDELILTGEYRDDTAYNSVKKMLEKNRPTAIFSANDIMALGVVKAIKEYNLDFPNDIAVVGFDNLQYMDWSSLKLTTVKVDMDQLAEKAVDMLFSGEKGIYELLQPELVIRDSVPKIK